MDTKYWIQNPSWVCNPQSNTLNGITIFGHKTHSVGSQEHKSNLGTKPTNKITEGLISQQNKNKLCLINHTTILVNLRSKPKALHSFKPSFPFLYQTTMVTSRQRKTKKKGKQPPRKRRRKVNTKKKRKEK